jgi:hypothetical protein
MTCKSEGILKSKLRPAPLFIHRHSSKAMLDARRIQDELICRLEITQQPQKNEIK